MRRCKGTARVAWEMEIPDGMDSKVYDHPAIEVMIELLGREGRVKLDGGDTVAVEVDMEIDEDGVEITEDEEY